jgi:hypothetical protein
MYRGLRAILMLSVGASLGGLTSCSQGPTQNSLPPDVSELLGVTEEQAKNALGQPVRTGNVREGLRELYYEEPRFSLFVENGRVASFVIRDGSTVQLDSGIGCGDSLQDVVTVYGDYTSQLEIEEALVEYDGEILYHQVSKTPEVERYHLRYPEQGLQFTFYPDRTVHSVWIGKLF